MEQRIIETCKDMESRFGTGVITGAISESQASFEALSQQPEIAFTNDVALAWSSESVK